MKQSSRFPNTITKCSEQLISFTVIIALSCISACSSCEQEVSHRAVPYEKQETQERCTKVGERCRLRKGVLGVCLPGAPMSEGGAERGLICTPQH